MNTVRTALVLALGGFALAIPSPAEDSKETGSIVGVVKFKGPKPERKPNEAMLAQAFCKESCAGKAPLEEKWVFGRNGDDDTFANVLVYVSKGLEGRTFDPPKEPVVLDQVGCTYVPHVTAVMVGQTLEIRNSDATLHNVLCNPFKNRPFNDGMPVKGGKIEKVFSRPEFKIDLRCVLHPWMLAYVHVMEHPYYAITTSDGSFEIKGLPPGDYELSVKHESSRFAAEPATLAVKVVAGASQKLDFVYSDKQQ